MKTRILISLGGKGGLGKTSSMVAITDYLYAKKFKVLVVDCDTENATHESCLDHAVNGQAMKLNLRLPLDRDRLLTESSESGAEYVVVDLPGNSTGDLSVWLRDVATLDLIQEMNLEMIGVGVVTPERASPASVIKWITALGDRASYLVVLNRKDYEPTERSVQDTFPEWFKAAVPILGSAGFLDRITTIELPNMEFHAMEALRKLGKLPGKAVADPKVPVLIKQRIKTWRSRIAEQLDGCGVFKELETTTK